MKAREPMWTLSDLAENQKVAISTLRDRLRKAPLPERKVESALPAGKFGAVAKSDRYCRSMLLEWFRQQDQQTPFKRKA